MLSAVHSIPEMSTAHWAAGWSGVKCSWLCSRHPLLFISIIPSSDWWRICRLTRLLQLVFSYLQIDFFVNLHIQSIFSNIQLQECWPKTKDNEKTSYHRVGSQKEALLWKARSLREEEVSSLTRSAAVQLPSCTLKTGFWQLYQSLRSYPILPLFSFSASPSSRLSLSASCSWCEVVAWTHSRPLSGVSSQRTVEIGLGSRNYSAATLGV